MTNLDVRPADAITQVRHLSTDDLRRELGQAITYTARSVQYLAVVWSELKRRGEDLSQIKIGLGSYLEEVAAGRLAAEAVVSFAGSKMVLRWLSRQPIERQRKIAAGELVTVRDPDGHVRQVSAAEIDARDLKFIDLTASISGSPEKVEQERPDALKPKRAAVTALLTDHEYNQVVAAATKAEQTINDFVRRSLGLPPWNRRGKGGRRAKTRPTTNQ